MCSPRKFPGEFTGRSLKTKIIFLCPYRTRYSIIKFSKDNKNVTIEEALLNKNYSNIILCHPDINSSLTEVLFPTLESRQVYFTNIYEFFTRTCNLI